MSYNRDIPVFLFVTNKKTMNNRHKLIFMLALALMCVTLLHAETVRLNFYVGHSLIHSSQVTTGSSYTLSDYVSNASMKTYECRDYTFAGWQAGAPARADDRAGFRRRCPSTPAASSCGRRLRAPTRGGRAARRQTPAGSR